MFTEYNIAGIPERTGWRPNQTGWANFMKENQFSATNHGPEFGKIVMKVFSRIETGARVSRQMRDDPIKYHPLSVILKGRHFEHIVANEREACPQYFRLNEDQVARNGAYETFQFFPDNNESIVCLNCSPNDIQNISEATYSGIASEIVKKKLRDGTVSNAQTPNAQLARDSFASGTPAPAHRIGQAGVAPQNLYGGGFYGHGNPDSPQLVTFHDPALHIPTDFEARVQLEVGILKGPHVKWVWNRHFIKDNAFHDIRKTACNVLRSLVTGSFAYMVRDITPANFEQKLRQLVVGHNQNATQQAHKLMQEIKGCEESRVSEFDGTHPLVKNMHDIPAFLEIQKAKFEELKALAVDTEFKMHSTTFMRIIMTCVGTYMTEQAAAYIKRLNTANPYTFEELQAIVSTYESNNFLTRTRGTAFQAAARSVSGSRNRNPRVATSDSTRVRSRWARALEVEALVQDTNRIR